MKLIKKKNYLPIIALFFQYQDSAFAVENIADPITFFEMANNFFGDRIVVRQGILIADFEEFIFGFTARVGGLRENESGIERFVFIAGRVAEKHSFIDVAGRDLFRKFAIVFVGIDQDVRNRVARNFGEQGELHQTDSSAGDELKTVLRIGVDFFFKTVNVFEKFILNFFGVFVFQVFFEQNRSRQIKSAVFIKQNFDRMKASRSIVQSILKLGRRAFADADFACENFVFSNLFGFADRLFKQENIAFRQL